MKLGLSGCAAILLAFVCSLYATALAGETTKIPLEVFAGSASLENYPIEIGVPFSPGVLKDTTHLRLLKADGTEVLCQVQEISRYLDGSLRAALLIFLSPISDKHALTYTVEVGDDVSRKASPKHPITVLEKEDTVSMASNELAVLVEKNDRLISSITANGKSVLSKGLDLFIQKVGQKELVFATQTSIQIEEKGPVRSVVLVKGSFTDSSDATSEDPASSTYHYQARIHTYAGTHLVRLQHTILALDAKAPFELSGWGLRVRSAAKKASCGINGVVAPLALSNGESLFQNDAIFGFEWGTLNYEEGLAKAKKRKPFALGELPGWRYRMQLNVGEKDLGDKKADGWLHANTSNGNIGTCVRDFWQQCPKAFSGDENGMIVWLHSPKGKPFIAKAGTAKTHELIFDFSPGHTDAKSTQKLNAVFQEWPHARLAPEWVCATQLFGSLLPRSDSFTEHYNRMTDVCLAYIRQCDSRFPIVHTATWQMIGNADFGDVTRAITWNNVSNEHTRAFTLEFLRGGDREWARIGARAARHHADIDVCHTNTSTSHTGQPWDIGRDSAKNQAWPFKGGFTSTRVFQARDLEKLKARIKTCEDTYATLVKPRDTHQYRPGKGSGYWCHAGGAMPYALLSGDRRAHEVLQEQTDWILNKKDWSRATTTYSFRLNTLLDAHEATGEAKFMLASAVIIKELIAWWKQPVAGRRDIADMKKRLASPKMERWLKIGAMLKGYTEPSHGFWEMGLGGGGRWIESQTRRDLAVFRFMRLNTPEAKTDIDNSELKQMLADCMETIMLRAVPHCTPGYIASWTMAANLGLWSESTRKTFEDKVLLFASVARRPSPTYPVLRNGIEPSPIYKYKLPFLHFKWHTRKKTGAFAPFDPDKISTSYISVSALSPFVCHLNEFGIGQAMLNYPHFVSAWKIYHEKYLKQRMNDDGVLEFSIHAIE